ncbi:LysM peptidoglycan-binding domain-containing protein [Bdellovibrio svalbardensis]|uniref:LysM peptidoglycan-binding domain-containing protein n=1 Tax=Bdellovibrio svalbardensis TaxID=2972972 RepID=A0ABT6DLU8_9BACT|nr:LysM peptidoglycan-binding domain-containing protein [Bdellovibrio svalbardensis]MDG0816108.1 LysM peptidoglycan-binding domain-containing protein [Bdellovibrio svalbardensis]
MKNKKFSVLLAMIFCALVAQAQDAPPDSTWDADPLDVLEPKKQQEVVEPTVPEFKEIPEAGAEPKAEPAHTEVPADIPPPAPEAVAAPSMPVSPMGNEPDMSREAEFNRIYKKYNEQPTSVEAWEKAVGKRQAETYQVQKGNTLWDISTTFFGDPNFWPKIWSFNNGAIGNPHEIDPSMSIRFFAGNMDEAPTVELAATKADKDAVVDSSKVGEKTAVVTTLPAHKVKGAPVLKALPGSLPSRRFGVDMNQKSAVEIEVPAKSVSQGLEYLGYYLDDTPVSGVGVVTATEMDLKSAGEFVYIYVRLDQEGGKDFIVQKNLAQIEDPRKKGRKAQMVEIQGQIEVLERVHPQKNIYRAIVKKAIQPVEVGSLLTPGQLPMIDPKPGAISSGAGARIIGGQFGNNRTLFGSNSLIFLDGGTSQGFAEGQSFGIFADEAVRNRQTDAIQNDRQIGVVKIVKATPNFATAYIARSSDDILKGDYVGQVVKQAMNAPESAPVVEQHAAPSAAPSEDLEKEFDLDNAPAAAPSTTPPDGGADDSDLTL